MGIWAIAPVDLTGNTRCVAGFFTMLVYWSEYPQWVMAREGYWEVGNIRSGWKSWELEQSVTLHTYLQITTHNSHLCSTPMINSLKSLSRGMLLSCTPAMLLCVVTSYVPTPQQALTSLYTNTPAPMQALTTYSHSTSSPYTTFPTPWHTLYFSIHNVLL